MRQNRRRSKRIKTVRYTALVQRYYGRWCYGPRREASLLNFNRDGAGLCSEHHYREGEPLRLILQSAHERIANIRVRVRNVRHLKGECYFGLEFVTGKDFEQPLTDAQRTLLLRLEELISNQLV